MFTKSFVRLRPVVASVALLLWGCSLAFAEGDSAMPAAVYAQSGDVSATSAVVWGHCNGETDAYLVVDMDTSPEGFTDTFEFDDSDGDLAAKLGPLVKLRCWVTSSSSG